MVHSHMPVAVASLTALLITFPLFSHAHKVIGITDGDTLTLLVDQRPLKVRLANIDAPETRQPFGARARQHLSTLCFGKDAEYEPQDVDRYGRTVAVVYCDGIEANRAQVANGSAWVYPKYNRDPSLPQLERESREMRRGLFADSEPVRPWDWRRAKARLP